MKGRMWRAVLGAGLGAVMSAAPGCGKSEALAGDGSRTAAEADCPARVLTLDGQAQDWHHALAYRAGGNTVIRIYNHDGVSCEDLLQDKILRPPRDEQLINIAMMSGDTYVTWAPDPSGGTRAKSRVVTKADKAGDTLRVCLPEAVTLVGKGVHEGHTVVLQGLIEAHFCGDHP
ncbi:MAG: hypothetical protein H6746_00300 [Deltaproteobacteria bacterium]|nr:hypothetical protein [Deltaproteobacteria bacterium]